jgi:hypothetical protein
LQIPKKVAYILNRQQILRKITGTQKGVNTQKYFPDIMVADTLKISLTQYGYRAQAHDQVQKGSSYPENLQLVGSKMDTEKGFRDLQKIFIYPVK